MSNTNYVDKPLCVEKSSESGRMSLSFQPTLEAAKSYVGSAENYKIVVYATGEIVAAHNPEFFDKFNGASK